MTYDAWTAPDPTTGTYRVGADASNGNPSNPPIVLTWNPYPGAVSYKVYATTPAGTTFTSTSVTAATMNYVLSPLTLGGLYKAYITAVNSSGSESAASTTVSYTVPKNPSIFSSGPYYSTSNSCINFSWYYNGTGSSPANNNNNSIGTVYYRTSGTTGPWSAFTSSHGFTTLPVGVPSYTYQGYFHAGTIGGGQTLDLLSVPAGNTGVWPHFNTLTF